MKGGEYLEFEEERCSTELVSQSVSQ